jgi:enamine deaminase RidA (YjgF/YER057c/UK114 family)
MRKSVMTGSPWEAKVGYCRAVRIGNIIEVSGTTASEAGVVQCIADPFGQTIHILNTIQKAIEELGGSISDVIRTRVYCTDITQWEDIGRGHSQFFEYIKPAMVLVEVSNLIHPNMLVEIEATCILS